MTFVEPAIKRLADYLGLPQSANNIEQLTPDASVREFFRIPWENSTAIVCVYPEAITDSLPQIDVTRLFLANDLPVARIFKTEPHLGFLIHQDFGDRVLYADAVFDSEKDHYLDQAIGLIARIQLATKDAYNSDSIASTLMFDEFKLTWELNFFKKHYFESLKQRKLDSGFSESLDEEFAVLTRALESYARVLTHRDFHAANLMLVGTDLKIIDHQDARIGAASYDLVSLLLDRIEDLPGEDFLTEKKTLLKTELERLGLSAGDDFDREFELVTIQRCLKAIGTFSNQAANFDKISYLKFVKPMFSVVARAANKLDGYPTIAAMAAKESEIQAEAV